ncbi:folylpolyglutamate synthase [Nostoc linckia z18]|uniref:tetrahydrofolate synthase n=2 Tax=Nostoc linckia TaxID=92942 RepID=A0A9Q6ELS2_NOSLI|nr:folylpolyglutamate synthase/dihydrofolate synthase family protein [Nostoc linckia]PHK39659.1 folylpolyglutamate synthase [Nostoc linckia z15]PHK45520.1 folylpolyglutamate synthase [Nostoc linckia z16]PHJ66066.1 folylpolyglutamate synthase [Nostoc linckia z1]PHJ68973.1 folylpolyglutamate synthase [Nostoc linckia z3]PHJ74624.1 folylpolyglutamate synthase [Nostoc linckia z2]
MDIDSIIQPLQRFGVHLGLDRILNLLANLGNPHHHVPVIHVAGTNGKGSVCAYLSSVLTEAGYRTGRYTSPHLVDWTERICLNEKQISSEELNQLFQQVQAAIPLNEQSPTQFEVITAAAWLYFAQAKVDVAVVEVGLGGRLDATNVCLEPLVTIITSISREHWQHLGPTVADIAREKAGILKPGRPVVVGKLPPDAEEMVRSRALELQCPIFTPQPARQIATGWAEYERGGDGETCTEQSRSMGRLVLSKAEVWGDGGSEESPHKSIKYPLPLAGQIQLNNSALALTALEILQQQGWHISQTAIKNGMAKTRWPGRMQWTSWKNYQLLLDGAHNTAAAEVLRHYVDSLDAVKHKPVTWIMGMFADKDHADIFTALLRPGDRLFLVPISVEPWPGRNSANLDELANLAYNLCPQLSDRQIHPDLFTALETATSTTTKEDLIVVCGSLYLVGDFLQMRNQ